MDNKENDDITSSNEPNELHNQNDVDFDIEARSFSNHEPQLLQDKRDEEVATELTPEHDRIERVETDDIDLGVSANNVMGWIALALSIASFFMLPIILGGAGIVLGFVARNRDAEWIGNTAIVAGVISIIITLFILPFV